MTLGNLLSAVVNRNLRKTAIVFEDQSISYEQQPSVVDESLASFWSRIGRAGGGIWEMMIDEAPRELYHRVVLSQI